MKLTKIIIITIIFSFITLHASALSFSNLSVGGTGSINTGNGYFDDPQSAFGYTGDRNVFTVTEDTQVNLLEPISWTSGTTPTAYLAINSSFGTLKDSVVHNGFLYFVDGTTLKKKKSRDFGSSQSCESNDTSIPSGCIITISTGVSPTIRVYNNVLYFMAGTSLKHLDAQDSVVPDFTIAATAPAGLATEFSSFTIAKPLSVLTIYVVGYTAPNVKLYACNSVGCTAVATISGNTGVSSTTLYTTTSRIYALDYQAGGGNENLESEYYILNSTAVSVNYATNNLLAQSSRAYVGGFSTIGLIAQSATTYETYNSNEAGTDSLQLSEGSGIVEYVNKEIDVPNANYYNDSTIPINVNLKFIISDTNHTNYLTSATWHLLAFDPTGVMVEDHDLPIVCTQTQPWWDPFGVLSLFLVDLVTPWACDGTQTVQYSPNPGQFWMNGTWEIKLTEQIPGTTSILSTDTYNIVNQSSTGTGVVNPPAPCPTCGLGGGGTINTNTSLQIIQVFSFVAFWGFIIWLGILFTVIGIMAKSPSGVNGLAVIVVAWLSAVFIALIGLFDPFKIYIIVLSTLIAAVLFRFGKNATTTED